MDGGLKNARGSIRGGPFRKRACQPPRTALGSCVSRSGLGGALGRYAVHPDPKRWP